MAAQLSVVQSSLMQDLGERSPVPLRFGQVQLSTTARRPVTREIADEQNTSTEAVVESLNRFIKISRYPTPRTEQTIHCIYKCGKKFGGSERTDEGDFVECGRDGGRRF